MIIAVAVLILSVTGCKGPEGEQAFRHPLKDPPRFTEHVRCDNCGMDRNRFARTRYEFETSKGRFHTCSLSCVVILSMKLGESPQKVKVAEYLRPERMLDAERAFYVIGSRAPGTMTRVSKLAFSDRAGAEDFIKRYGGRLSDFDEAFREAESEVLRLRKGS